MRLTHRLKEIRAAIGPWSAIRRKFVNAARTVWNTVYRKERRRRLTLLRERGMIETIPTEWQIWMASYDMMTGYIIPSNDEFYANYDKNQYWLQFLRVLDEPSTMMDPTGLAVDAETVIQHLLHVVHCSAGYDIGLLEMFPDGLDRLEAQLRAHVAGTHPRQAAIADLIERPQYPAELLDAVRLYRQDPETHWKVTTFETPDGCDALFDFGIERYGTLGRLLRYAHTLPPSPWASLKARLSNGKVLTAE